MYVVYRGQCPHCQDEQCVWFEEPDKPGVLIVLWCPSCEFSMAWEAKSLRKVDMDTVAGIIGQIVKWHYEGSIDG